MLALYIFFVRLCLEVLVVLTSVLSCRPKECIEGFLTPVQSLGDSSLWSLSQSQSLSQSSSWSTSSSSSKDDSARSPDEKSVHLDADMPPRRPSLDALSFNAHRSEPDMVAEAFCALPSAEWPWAKLVFSAIDLPTMKTTCDKRLAFLQEMVTKAGCDRLQSLPMHKCKNRTHLMGTLAACSLTQSVWLRSERRAEKEDQGILCCLHPRRQAKAKVALHVAGKGRWQDTLGSLLCQLGNGGLFHITRGLTADIRKHPPAVGESVVFQFERVNAKGLPMHAILVLPHHS
jgi:hypothetical protein